VHYLPGGAIYVVEDGASSGDFYYTYTDHLGSILALTDANGTVIAEQNFDPWGRKRNPSDWSYDNIPDNNPVWLRRGFTGHEHLEMFALINMNNRMYDPVIGRMLAPDNYVQDATFTQNYNRYSYAWNNPLVYTDPDGDLIVAVAVVSFLLFTETGYDIQKYVSPVAVKVDLPKGTHQRGIGIQASVGIPQIAPVSARAHGSVGYYTKNYDVTPGWQTTYGYEIGITPFFVVGSTTYNNPGNEFDQRNGHARIGIPGFNIKYENDGKMGSLGDGGDRHRTAAAKIQFGALHVGINLFTGDPGLDPSDRNVNLDKGGKYGLYVINAQGDDPDKYRAGVGYVGIGPFRFGNDSESRRHKIQNELVHDKVGSPHFKELDRPNRFYFQVGTGSGFLW
jgi:RHS repeat-associated protein